MHRQSPDWLLPTRSPSRFEVSGYPSYINGAEKLQADRSVRIRYRQKKGNQPNYLAPSSSSLQSAVLIMFAKGLQKKTNRTEIPCNKSFPTKLVDVLALLLPNLLELTCIED